MIFGIGLALCASSHAQANVIIAESQPGTDAATLAQAQSETSSTAVGPAITRTRVSATAPQKPTFDDDINDGKWHIQNDSYTWLPSIHGAAGIASNKVDMNVSAWDLVSNTTFGIQNLIEPQYKRVSIPIDFMWLRLNVHEGIASVPDTTANLKATISILTPKVAALIVDKPALKLYGTGGVRYWHLGFTESLTQSFSTSPELYQSADWVDFSLGGRGTMALSPKVSFTVAGDGGMGGADVDYQFAGFLNYQVDKILKWELKRRMFAQAGWRYMEMHYDFANHQTLFRPGMNGFVFGFATRYK